MIYKMDTNFIWRTFCSSTQIENENQNSLEIQLILKKIYGFEMKTETKDL